MAQTLSTVTLTVLFVSFARKFSERNRARQVDTVDDGIKTIKLTIYLLGTEHRFSQVTRSTIREGDSTKVDYVTV